MNSKQKKPRFYFNSQKTARTTIFWLLIISFVFLTISYLSLKSYEKNGFITVSQRSGSFEIHGPAAMNTIYFYTGCFVLLFSLGCYFSIIYVRVRNAQRNSSNIIVPEKEIPEKIICPSCLNEGKNYFSSNLCKQCYLDEISKKPNSKFKKYYDFFYPDFDELSVFLIGFVLSLLLFFNSECRNDVIDLIKPNTKHIVISICMAIGVSLVIIIGMLTSFYHLLVFSKKNDLSLFFMKTFALMVLAYIGIKSGIYVLNNQNYLFVISPVWNLLMGAVCYCGLGMIDEIPFNQEDSTYPKTILSLILVLIIFLFLNFILELYWPIILSICINYVVCINRGAINSKYLKFYSLHS